jgi:hypothetical protein
MKKIIIITVASFYSIISTAQIGFSISPNFSYGSTSVYNKEDTKGFKHDNGYINPLPMKTTYKSNYGINIGVTFNKKRTGLIGIYTGIGKMDVLQNYSNNNTTLSINNPVRVASTALNYLNIPIFAKFRMGKYLKFVPTISAGLNILLLQNYQDEYKETVMLASDSTVLNITRSVSGGKAEIKNPVLSVANFNSGYFTKNVVCSYFSFGLDYQLSKQIALNINLHNTYSLNNPEDRSILQGSTFGQEGTSLLRPYEAYISKMFYRGTSNIRGTSHIINTGLNVGITFNFFK